MTEAMQPSQGGFAGKAHVFPLRVYYEDTDAGGIVYYANYLKFAERARTEVLRELGVGQWALMEGEGLAFAVRRCTADYLAPARLDDALEVSSTIRALGAASLDIEQVIRRAGEAADLVRLDVRLAVINRAGRPVRIPEDIAELLRPYVVPADAAGDSSKRPTNSVPNKKRA